ncbi:YihY/virulence factor BrkB family protein [Conexibacter sp. W3-3-2]|uniref:YihY/virulence factor BrkB family protein n=1 Tax=Conexibacter sp. W3-3-2 TaxID=2675227 RepID=UPI0018A9018E|nr:YihY/virulence factor BrkB family protein [Conexibacter sp. W3-3-2]
MSTIADRDSERPAREPGTHDDADGALRPWPVLVRTVRSYLDHNMTDHAASLTYFAMMSLFPSLLAGIAVLSLVGEVGLAQDAADYLIDRGADASTAEVVRSTLARMIETSGGAAGFALLLSFGLALNGASGAFGAAGRALNVVWAANEDRGFVRRKAQDIAMALVVILLFAIVVIAMFLGGGVADDLLGTIGLGETGAAIWSIARFPLAIAAAMVGYSIIYAYAPAVEQRRWRWITVGSAAGVTIWIVASAAFAVYIRNFSSYGAAYGAFGAAIVLLLWLYVSANAFLLGAELNATIERSRAAGRGGPPPPMVGAPEPPTGPDRD